jgi:L-seryl-tRNA(Ser) seleniumtransferase
MCPGALEAFHPQIEEAEAEAGGGSLPGTLIPTRCITLKPSSISVQSLEERLRGGDPPILTRIQKGNLILDMLTVTEEELKQIAARLRELANLA